MKWNTALTAEQEWRSNMKLNICFANSTLTVDDYDDIEDVKEAIKYKEKWVYLFYQKQYVNLDMVENIVIIDD